MQTPVLDLIYGKKTAAYDSSQVSGFLDEGGVADSLKRFGALTGGALGAAAGLGSSLANPGSQSHLGQTALGATVGAGLGHLAGGLASKGIKGLNRRYAKAEEMTGIPRSKLEELPIASRANLLVHADREMRHAKKHAEDVAINRFEKLAEHKDFSATQLREYQLKHLEPHMGPLMSAAGAAAGGALGAGIASNYGIHPLIGAAPGAVAGYLLSDHARRAASESIRKRYLTRRVMEEAGSGTPLSEQVKALRAGPHGSAGVTLGTEQVINRPGMGNALRITSNPRVETI